MPTLSFSEALEIRYVEDIDVSPIEPCEIFLVGSFPGRSSPSGRLVLPRTLTLNCCEIDRAGTLRKIEELCHNVEELDLAQNQLCDLNEVLIDLVLFTDHHHTYNYCPDVVFLPPPSSFQLALIFVFTS